MAYEHRAAGIKLPDLEAADRFIREFDPPEQAGWWTFGFVYNRAFRHWELGPKGGINKGVHPGFGPAVDKVVKEIERGETGPPRPDSKQSSLFEIEVPTCRNCQRCIQTPGMGSGAICRRPSGKTARVNLDVRNVWCMGDDYLPIS